jgi:hypothetical protein
VQIDPDDLWKVLAAGSSVGVAAIAGVRWVIGKFEKSDAENRAARDKLESQMLNAETRCRAENDAHSLRIRELESQSHKEDREDRVVLLKVLQMNANAFSRFAEKLPDTTPASGVKALNSDH